MNRYMMMLLLLMANSYVLGVWYDEECTHQEGAAMRRKQEIIFVLINDVARLAQYSSRKTKLLKKLSVWGQGCVSLERFDSRERMLKWMEQCEEDLKWRKERLEAKQFAQNVTRKIEEERERPDSPEMHALIELEEMQNKENMI